GHDGPVLLCAESAGRREVLLEALAGAGIEPVPVDSWPAFLADPAPLAIAVAPIDRGLYLGPGAPMLLCEAQLYGTRVAQRRRRKRETAVDTDAVFRDLNELRPGAPVVHLEHGVGRYVGLTNLAVDGADAEFLTLEYAEGARLYVPVASLHLISRYSGSEPELAPLHR
ncbi:MAG TPA: transcription-repair coupling factor, partial [Halieaceae bacterium]|nr:transcription-repair coupling factor [Halieaceae bacterium]